jgi:membrane-bound ClpP family serine protease
VPKLYNGVSVRKRFSSAEQEALKSGLIDLAAMSEQEIVSIRSRRRK